MPEKKVHARGYENATEAHLVVDVVRRTVETVLEPKAVVAQAGVDAVEEATKLERNVVFTGDIVNSVEGTVRLPAN